MGSCGMYDYAGEWLYRIGMPAKSGVTGGIIAVLPGQLGIGVFSPPLDPRGNSVRGLKVCEDLSRFFDLHLLNTPHASLSVIRLKFTAAEINSSRVRTVEESQILRQHGGGIRVYQLQGQLVLSTAEVVVRCRTGGGIGFGRVHGRTKVKAEDLEMDQQRNARPLGGRRYFWRRLWGFSGRVYSRRPAAMAG